MGGEEGARGLVYHGGGGRDEEKGRGRGEAGSGVRVSQRLFVEEREVAELGRGREESRERATEEIETRVVGITALWAG